MLIVWFILAYLGYFCLYAVHGLFRRLCGAFLAYVFSGGGGFGKSSVMVNFLVYSFPRCSPMSFGLISA